MPGEICLLSKLDSTCRALKIPLLVVYSLEVHNHISLLSKPPPTLLALVVDTFMDNTRMLV